MTLPYAKLARKMAITALVVALLPLNGLGMVIYYYFTTANQEKLKDEMRLRAQNRAGAIELFLAERTALLEVLAHAARLKELDTVELAKLLQIMNRRAWSFVDLGVIDAEGNHRAYVGPYPLKGQNYKDAAWFQQVMSRGVYVSDVFLGVRKVPHFVIAVRRDEGSESWVLRATIDSEVFNRLVKSAQVGSRGDAYLVDAQGRLQTPSRFDGKILDRVPFDVRAVPPGSHIMQREVGQEKAVLTAFSWLSKDNWLLVIDEDPNEVLGPLSWASNLELVILAVANLLIIAAVLLMVRLFVRQLESGDRERAALDAQLAHSARLVSLGRMAAGVAHEINNPLAAIGELAGELDDILTPQAVTGLPEGELLRDNLAKIQAQVERVRGVTHRMLKFARRMEPHLESVDVNDTLRESLSFVEKEALFNNVTLEMNLDPRLPQVRSDRAQLQQVFLNLCNNAMDAVPAGGKVTVSTANGGPFLEVRVTDDGPGIPSEVADRIFDPFFTTKSPGQGTGLGLSISHSIMQKLGGELTFESPPGQGATFIVRIPQSPPEPV